MFETPKDSDQLSAVSYQLLGERPNIKDTKTAVSYQQSAFSFRMKDITAKTRRQLTAVSKK
jgi:hypothetical protein